MLLISKFVSRSGFSKTLDAIFNGCPGVLKIASNRGSSANSSKSCKSLVSVDSSGSTSSSSGSDSSLNLPVLSTSLAISWTVSHDDTVFVIITIIQHEKKKILISCHMFYYFINTIKRKEVDHKIINIQYDFYQYSVLLLQIILFIIYPFVTEIKTQI